MDKLVSAFVAIVVALMLAPQTALAFRSVAPGDTAPVVSGKDFAGREVNIPFGERTIVLLFWRADQKFSLEALRDLEQIKREFTRRGVDFFAITEESASAAAAETLKGLSLTYTVLADLNRKAEERYGVIVFPSTGIVGADGRLKFYLPSRNSNYREIVRGRLEVELGLIKEKDFEQRMHQIGEELGSDQLKAEQHLKVGLRFTHQGKTQEAMQEFQQALVLAPALADAHLALGYAYLDLNDIAGAQKEFEQVLKVHPASPGARVGIGITRVRRGLVDEGIKLLEEAVGINPDPVQGYYELGVAYEKKGDLTQALHAYKWAVRKLLQGRR
jgi:tetratricopeptide (TPR) repeat protein